MKVSIKRTVTRTLTATEKQLVEGGGDLEPARDRARELREEVTRSFDIQCEAKFVSKRAFDRVFGAFAELFKKLFPWL
jgi:hypothetical protein